MVPVVVRGVAGTIPKRHGAAGLRLQQVAGVAMTATAWSCDRMHRASGAEHWAVVVVAVVGASHGCGYLPRYVAYTGYRVGNYCSRDCSPMSLLPAAGQAAAEVGVADVKLGPWLKMESNYPCLLSRTVVGKWQDARDPEACMALAAKCSPRILSAILLDCLGAFAEAKEVAHCYCRLA